MKNPLVATVTLLALGARLAFADSTWISPSSGTWSLAANWNNGLPNGGSMTILADGSVQHTLDVGGTAQNTLGIRFDLLVGGSGFTLNRDGSPGGFNIRAGGTVNGMVNNDDSIQTFNVPMIMFSVNGFAGSGAAQTWNAAAGNIIISGNYGAGGGTDNTINNNGGRLTIDGSFNTTIGTSTGRGDIVGAGGLTKNGSGTLILGGTQPNTFSGVFILNAGTLQLAKVNALQNTPTFVMNGGNLSGSVSNTIGGALGVEGSATITYSGPAGYSFANSSGTNWSGGLQIFGWNTNGTDVLRFGTSAAGLTAAQLAGISFPDLPSQFAQIDGAGFITPIPEPSVVVLSVVGGVGLAAGYIYRRRRG